MDKFRDNAVRLALVLALLTPAYFAFAALGVKFGLFDWRMGLGGLTMEWGPRVIGGVAALAAIALALAFFTPPRRGVLSACIALLIPLLGAGYGIYVGRQAQSIAPIHDISTDLEKPPVFSAEVTRARAAVPAGNDLDLHSKRDSEGTPFVEWQRRQYGDITHVSTGLASGRAFEIASELAHSQNWRMGRVDAANGVIEAVAETFWFGFKDDIAIRIRPDGLGARIDMRSVSRVGRSDLGANAKRMRAFLATLRARLEDAEAQSGPAPAPPREGSEGDAPPAPPP
jgi:uncharacterized protein (DUF1499 family)